MSEQTADGWVGGRYILKGGANIKKQEKKADSSGQKLDKAKAVEELINFWSEIINDDSIDIRQRIKASELKAKASGIFVDTADCNDSVGTDSVMFFGEDDLL